MLVSPLFQTVFADVPEISADQPIAYQDDTGLLTAVGNAVFVDEHMRLEADEIRYDRRRDRVEAYGNVRVTRAGFRLVTEWLHYRARDRHVTTGPFRAGHPPLFIEGEAFEGDMDQLDFSKATIYFHEPMPGSPRLSAESVQWIPRDSIRANGLRLAPTGGWSLPLPRADYRFGAPTLRFRGELGQRGSVGAFAQTQFIYPVNRNIGVGANLDLYSRRGVMLGPVLRYQQRERGSFSLLEIDTGFIRDQGGPDVIGTDRTGDRISRHRGFADWGVQHRRESLNITARGTWMADSEVLRDFRNRDFRSNSEPDSFFEITHLLDNWVLSAFVRPQLNRDYNLTERLPEISLDYLPTALGATPLYHQAALRYTRYRLQRINDTFAPLRLPDFPLGLESANGDAVGLFDRLDSFYSLQWPITVGRGIQWNPVATVRWTHYDSGWQNGVRTANSINRLMAEVGFDLAARAESYSSYRNRRWDIDGLRHQVRGFIQYRYMPNGSYRADEIAALDRTAYGPLRPVLDLTRLRHVDTLRDLNVARFGWENRLQTRSRDGAVRDLAELHFYQDLDFHRVAGQPGWDALYVEGRFHPARWLSLAWEQKWRPESQRLEASRALLRLQSADVWTADFSADFLNNAIELFGLDVHYRWSPRYLLNGGWRYNARTEQLTHQRYGIRRAFGRAWEMEVYLSIRSGDARESRTSLGVAVYLLQF